MAVAATLTSVLTTDHTVRNKKTKNEEISLDLVRLIYACTVNCSCNCKCGTSCRQKLNVDGWRKQACAEQNKNLVMGEKNSSLKSFGDIEISMAGIEPAISRV